MQTETIQNLDKLQNVAQNAEQLQTQLLFIDLLNLDFQQTIEQKQKVTNQTILSLQQQQKSLQQIDSIVKRAQGAIILNQSRTDYKAYFDFLQLNDQDLLQSEKATNLIQFCRKMMQKTLDLKGVTTILELLEQINFPVQLLFATTPPTSIDVTAILFSQWLGLFKAPIDSRILSQLEKWWRNFITFQIPTQSETVKKWFTAQKFVCSLVQLCRIKQSRLETVTIAPFLQDALLQQCVSAVDSNLKIISSICESFGNTMQRIQQNINPFGQNYDNNDVIALNFLCANLGKYENEKLWQELAVQLESQNDLQLDGTEKIDWFTKLLTVWDAEKNQIQSPNSTNEILNNIMNN